MKKVVAFLLGILMLISCVACGGEAEKKEILYEGTYSSEDLNELSIVKEDSTYHINISLYRLAGIWGKGSLEEGEMAFAGIDPNGSPIGAKLSWENEDNVVLTFTASTWDYLPNGTEFAFQRNDGTSDTEDGSNQTEEIEETTSSDLTFIPELSSTSEILSADFEPLKIRMGYDLNGPSDSWRENAESLFYLKNLDEADFYMNISSEPPELIGVEDGEIVFFGLYGTTSYAYVKDFLPDEALTGEPARYSVNEGRQDAFVWKLQNGYLVIIAVSTNALDWYNRPAFGMVHARDLDYLAFID